MRVCTPITIRYGETDLMGVVYHANYLLYCDDREPLRYGEGAVVRTRVVSSRPTKTVYAYEVFREGQDRNVERPCCTGRSTHCLVDAATFKPVSLKRCLPDLYGRYAEVLEPDEGEGR